MVETVEECLYVKIEHPVIRLTSLACYAHSIDCRAARTVAIRVRVKHGFQTRLQVPPDNLLGNSVIDGRNAEHPGAATGPLRDVHPPYRRWKIASRGQPVPELVKVVGQIGLKLQNRLPVYASRPLVGLHFLEGFPDLPLRDIERLCLYRVAPPVTG